MEERNSMYQGEVHLECNLDLVLLYVVAGVGVTNFDPASEIASATNFVVGGIGAEIPVYENLSLQGGRRAIADGARKCLLRHL